MTQQPNTTNNARLNALRSTIQVERGVQNTTKETPASDEAAQNGEEVVASTIPEAESQVERKRHSLYFSAALNKQLDRAFLQVQHDIFPTQIEKYEFLEECVRFCVENMEVIREHLRESLGEPLS